MRSPRPPAGTSAVLDRLAVLLEAGVSPAAAWSYLASASVNQGAVNQASVNQASLNPAFEQIARDFAQGRPGGPVILDAFAGAAEIDAWSQVAASWAVAEETGAPLAQALRSAADSARSVTQARRDAEVALSGPVATARVVLALPVLGLLLGLGLGLDTVGVLVTRPIGWLCLAAATALVLIARSWNQRLVRRATPSSAVPGLDLDLVATALGGGSSWAVARQRVDSALAEFCPDAHDPTPAEELDELVRLSEQAGVPGGALLRSAALERRRDAQAATAKAAERLGVLLMLPLGACILPAFLLVGVVPLFLALLSSTGLGA